MENKRKNWKCERKVVPLRRKMEYFSTNPSMMMKYNFQKLRCLVSKTGFHLLVSMRYILLFAICLAALSIWFSPFNYVNATDKAVICSNVDSVIVAVQEMNQQDVVMNVDTMQINTRFLEEMRKNGQLLSSDEFASRITSYYNGLIAVLVGMFVFFTLVSYFSIKQKSDDKLREIEESTKEYSKAELKNILRDSRQVRDDIVTTITGELEDHFITSNDIESITSVITEIANKQKDLISEVAELQEMVANKESVVKEATSIKKQKTSKTRKEAK